MSQTTAVSVDVLERSYKLACPPEEVEALRAAAAHLDEQMRALRHRNKSSNGEKLAVVAALNITSELLRLRADGAAARTLGEQLAAIDDKLVNALRAAPSDLPAE